MRHLKSFFLLYLMIAAAVIAGIAQLHSTAPRTREWVFVWVDDEPASAHEQHASQVFGVDVAEAVANFQEANGEAIVICAARAGDGRCFRKSNIVFQP